MEGAVNTLRGGDEDILRFIPNTLGPNTSGQWELYFDGSDVGLTEDVDGVSLLADGRLVISTVGSVSVPGVNGKDEDLLAFTPNSLGTTTSGSWELYLDGSDADLTAGGEDIDAFHLVAGGATDSVLLSTVGNFSLPAVTGTSSDVIRLDVTSLGASTQGTFAPERLIDGSEDGLRNYNIDALAQPNAIFWTTHVVNLDGGQNLCSVADPSLCDADVFDQSITEITARWPNGDSGIGSDVRLSLAARDEFMRSADFRNFGTAGGYSLGQLGLNGMVEGQDFTRSHVPKFTESSPWSWGDFDVDGVEDGQAFVVWNEYAFGLHRRLAQKSTGGARQQQEDTQTFGSLVDAVYAMSETEIN